MVIGKSDKMTPAKGGRALVSEFDSKWISVTELDDVGHMMMTENPRPIRRVLAEAAESR